MRKLTIRDIMSTDLVTLDHTESIELAEETMRAARIHHLPVLEEGRLVGMVAQSDILRAQVSVFAELSQSEDRAIKQRIAAREVMSTSLRTVGPDTSLLEAAKILADHEYSSLPVVEDGELVGIVTERDFLHLVIRALEDEPKARLDVLGGGADPLVAAVNGPETVVWDGSLRKPGSQEGIRNEERSRSSSNIREDPVATASCRSRTKP